MRRLVEEELVQRNPGAKMPTRFIGYFLEETLRRHFPTSEDLRNFSAILIEKTQGGIVELNDLDREILKNAGIEVGTGALNLLPEITMDHKFLDTMEDAVKTSAFQA